ncbi:MAG: APC family permease [Actinobacteria bacterium]|nr:APC family permease [Actinomycetota bacterium]MBO0785137.1 APC family permease [Actinomycetota bacterium]
MTTESEATSVTRPADVGLRREIGLVGAIWSSETTIIGSGWLFGAWLAASAAGTAALLGWVIGGAAIIILALVHAELGGMYPVAGGTARFPHFAFGSVAGASFGFFSWVQSITTAPVECFAVMQYLDYYWRGLYDTSTSNVTGLGFVVSIILMAIFTVINFLAIRHFNRVNSAITWWKVAIPVLAIIVLFTQFRGGNFDSHGGFLPYGIKALFGAIPSAGIIFAYLGFEQVDQLAGEVRNPQRNVPLGVIGAILIGTVIYILLQVVFIGALRPPALAHGWAALGTNDNFSTGPLAFLAGVVGLSWLAVLLRVDAAISPSGTGLITTTATSRIGYGLARNRYYPQVFAKVDRRGVPWFSLILAFLLGLVFLLPFPSWHSLVSLVTGASVLMYAGAPLSLGAFRRQVPEATRPYRLAGASVISPLAFIVANMLIYWSGWLAVWKLGVVLIIGYVLIGIFMAFDHQRPPLNWRSASWLPVWLIGLGIISWQGQFGPGNTFRIPFWWDMLIVAVWSLAIYYWAQASSLPREEMTELVSRQAARRPEPAGGPGS